VIEPSRSDRDGITEFLRGCGFHDHGQTWLAEEISPGVLATGEYTLVRKV
jgi:hypothetical protein